MIGQRHIGNVLDSADGIERPHALCVIAAAPVEVIDRSDLFRLACLDVHALLHPVFFGPVDDPIGRQSGQQLLRNPGAQVGSHRLQIILMFLHIQDLFDYDHID